MSGGNGYDYVGEDAALRKDLQTLVDHQARIDQRLASTVGNINTTIDRLALGLGRISNIETALDLLLKRQEQQNRAMAALMAAHGVEVPA